MTKNHIHQDGNFKVLPFLIRPTRKPKGLVIPCRMGMLCCTDLYPSNLSVLTTPFYDVLTIWPLLTSHDLWTPPNITKKKNRSVVKGIQLQWILKILGIFCFLTSDDPIKSKATGFQAYDSSISGKMNLECGSTAIPAMPSVKHSRYDLKIRNQNIP